MSIDLQQLSHWFSQPVAVLGGGVSGLAAKRLLEAQGAGVVLYDETAGKGNCAEFTETAARGHRLCIASPGLAAGHPWLCAARSAGCAIRSELSLGSWFWRGRLIGVTGTNGKTSLTQLLAHAFLVDGKEATVAGNVGLPLAAVALEPVNSPQGVAVVEISSYQAETSESLGLEGMVWTNFDEDHLDRYGSMGSYFAAKARLLSQLKNTEGPVVLGPSVLLWAGRLGFPLAGKRCALPEIDREVLPQHFRLGPRFETFVQGLALWRALGGSDAVWKKAASSFAFDRHRIEWCGEKEGVRFWNDSKATNFHAALAGLRAVSGPVFWIAGGREKGGDLPAFIAEASSLCAGIFTLGYAPGNLEAALERAGAAATFCGDMESAVMAAYQRARSFGGGDVLLSPGFSSQDQFRSYAHRGEAFVNTVRALGVVSPPHNQPSLSQISS